MTQGNSPGAARGAGTTPPGGRTGAVRDGDGRKAFPLWLLALLLLLLAAVIALVLYLALRGGSKKTAVLAPAATTSQAAATSRAPTVAPLSSAVSSPPGPSSTALASATGTAGGAASRQGPLIGGGGTNAQNATGTSANGMGYGTVLFAENSATIDDQGQKVIAAAVEDLQTSKATTVMVTGYTDVVGSSPSNADLGQQRADNVKAALQTALGSGVTVTSVSKGKDDPVAANSNPDGSDNPSGRAQNRRAVITAG